MVNCGALPTPPSYPGGLSLSFSNTVYNSIAKYACNETGYKINGSLQTICGSDGNWNGTQPNCICKLINIIMLWMVVNMFSILTHYAPSD